MTKAKFFGSIKWLIAIAVIAGIGCGGYYYWQQKNKISYEFQTVAATRGDMTQAVTATGALNPVLNVQVGSQVSGNIQKLFADWNSPVKEGQLVAQIDPTNYQAAVTQAEGDLANAKAALELAQIQLKRTQDLRSKDSSPQATLDQALATVHQAEATVKTKLGALELAKANLEHCSIISPVAGIVISRNVDVGQTVAASLNAPVIFVIANDLAKMQIDTNVSEGDVGNIKEGQEVDFMVDAFPFTTFHGKVRQVRNAAISVQNVVTYDAVIDVNNAELKLKPGMTANASIIVAKREDVLKISNAALRVHLPDALSTPGPQKEASASPRPGSGRKKENDPARRLLRTVFVLRDGNAVPKPVQIKIGISDGVDTEVAEGLNEGDKVVTAVLSAQSSSSSASNPFGPPRMR